MARPSLMDSEPYLRDVVAKAMIEGRTNQEIADLLQRGVHKDTVTDYKRHPEVMRIANRMTQERVIRITSKIDSAIESALQHAEKMDIETLLKIRKEMLPERIEVTSKTDKSSIIKELWEAAEDNPEIANKIMQAQEAASEGD